MGLFGGDDDGGDDGDIMATVTILLYSRTAGQQDRSKANNSPGFVVTHHIGYGE